MKGAPSQEEPIEEFAQQASTFAEALGRRELQCEMLGEVIGHEMVWTEFRRIFKQHMRLWQEFTNVTLAVAGDGSVAGWLVESRKARCGQQVLVDADVEKRARSIPQIHRGLRLAGVRRVPLDDQRSMAVASFAGPARTDACDVFVNHTTGEVIGFMPTPAGKPSPLLANDAGAANAQELAWQQVEADLKARLGPDAAAQARDALKLVLQSGMRDEAGRSFWVFRLWRFFSTAAVSIDQTTKEIVGWYIEALKSDAPDRAIDEAAAVRSARLELQAVQGVQGPRVSFEKVGEAEEASVYWWHAEEGVNVEDDQTAVLLNATTGKPFSVWRKWRKISPDLFKQPVITQEQAVQAADQAINRGPAGPRGTVRAKAVIQVAADPERPSPVRDALVWLVGYSGSDRMGFTEVAVDCKNGDCLRITGW